MPDVGVALAFEDSATKKDSRVAGRYDDRSVPSLNIEGWFDIFQQGTLDSYIAMRARRYHALIVGPGGIRRRYLRSVAVRSAR